MLKNRTYPCKINGKYYPEEVDFDKIIENQKAKIIEDLENKFNNANIKVYEDEKFKKYIESVKAGDIDSVLNPENKLYRQEFDLTVLKFGSFEFVQDYFKSTDDETKNGYFEDLDAKIIDFQRTIIKLSETPNVLVLAGNLKLLYCNFLRNFAPQRLQYYTRYPIKVEILKNMQTIKDTSAKIQQEAGAYNIAIESDYFNKVYCLDNICQVIDLYQEFNEENDFVGKQEILAKIDKLTSSGVRVSGNVMGLINLTNSTSSQTLCQMVDSLARRMHVYQKPNISEDFDVTLKKFTSLKSISSIESLYSNSLALNKLIQLSRLDLLQDEERKKLNDFLDNEFERTGISQIDMSRFDQKINQKENFSHEEAEEFYNSVMRITFRDGKMPVKYNEFLIARLVEENPEFSNVLNSANKIIILENFASNRAEQALGKKYYVTFSNRFDKDDTQGEHTSGFIKLRPIPFENQSMDTVLKIATIFHEIRHGEQEKSLKEEQLNHVLYMMLKENIINNNDFGFYEKNYATMYTELDAEFFALSRMTRFLETLEVTQEFRKSKNCESIKQVVGRKLQAAKDGFSKAQTKEFSDGKMVSVEERFDEFVKSNPEIVEQEPLLKVEYNDDGSKKEIPQLFKEFIEKIKSEKDVGDNYDLYKYILLSNASRNPEAIGKLEDIQLPEDLKPSVKMALEKLRQVILARRIEEKGIEKEE